MGKAKRFCKKIERLVRDGKPLTLWGVDYAPERRSVIRTTYKGDGVGHSKCSECGRTVGPQYLFCPWCGARFAANAVVYDTREKTT